MNTPKRIFLRLAFAIFLGLSLGLALGWCHRNPDPAPEPTPDELVDGLLRKVTVVVLPPEQVAEECGEGALGCAYYLAAQEACLLILPPIPEDGRAPSLAGTSYGVAEVLIIWGHELAHCLAINIHGDSE